MFWLLSIDASCSGWEKVQGISKRKPFSMDNNKAEKKPVVTSKSLLTVGPTLHYSHNNVLMCWFLALLVFGLCCAFWSKIVRGGFVFFDIGCFISSRGWYLGDFVISGVNIFEYPWQILVLGLLMGILAVVPVLISQLMSFSYSLLFVLAIAFLANLPGLALSVLISCFAAACRPFRFRSRFTSIALCIWPQLLYWGFFGGAKWAEPIIWGYSYMPWICAWLVGLSIAGIVLGIGHLTRYRPGLVWICTILALFATVAMFEVEIGFDELDYQLYVVGSNPEQVDQFHTHSITRALDSTIANELVIENLLKAYFYPEDKIELRNVLKREIVSSLDYDSWPWWFIGPDELNYQDKREELLREYDKFIGTRPESRRMPIALYYEAILQEYSPDIKHLEQTEELRFYSDYPHERARGIWHRLYRDFSQSPESLEARWRIAKHWAGLGRFSRADSLLVEAEIMLDELLPGFEKNGPTNDNLFSPFRPPARSAMTEFKLKELQGRLNQLRSLISSQNHIDEPDSEKRLAKFVMLNPHSSQFVWELAELLRQMGEKDALRDNVLLAQTMLIADEQLRAEKLAELHEKYLNTDGGMVALYEFGLLKKSLWSQQETNSEQKTKLLGEARDVLTKFISLYPDSIYAEQVEKILSGLPKVE